MATTNTTCVLCDKPRSLHMRFGACPYKAPEDPEATPKVKFTGLRHSSFTTPGYARDLAKEPAKELAKVMQYTAQELYNIWTSAYERAVQETPGPLTDASLSQAEQLAWNALAAYVNTIR